MKKPLSRRQFIHGVGGLSLALPFMPSLLAPGTSNAAPNTIPKRFVALCTFDGYYQSVYYPTANANNQFSSDVFYKSLNDIDGPISEVFGPEFDAFRSKMNIYRGLDIPGSTGHSRANMLCAAAREVFGDDNPVDPVGTSKSIDVLLAKSSNFYKSIPQFSALRGQEPSYNYSQSFDKDANNKTICLPYDTNPKDMFQQVFGNRIADPGVAAQFNAKKVKLGDLLLANYKTLMGHRRISSEDKVTLDNFVTQLQDLNSRINSSPTILSCSTPTLRTLSSGYWDLMTEQDRANHFSNYIDTMVSAMACDLTRISVISMRLHGHDHALSHADPNNRGNQLQYLANTKKISAVYTELARKMDAYKEIDGSSMLDNSILYWGSEDAVGGAHTCMSMPAVSLGSAGGALKTGYYVDYRTRPFVPHPDQDTGMGRSYTQLLITFMRSLGLQPSDYLTSGDGGGFGSFNKNSSYSNGHYLAYEKFRNDVLPFVA
ncbi:MAG: DUF1552 domain-containing protein [Bdellovibrio sp.]|nr:DUF1552 domain-containing protein [Bdellovibrio sp.]